MSKNLEDLASLKDMSAEERSDLFDYFDQRPWLKTEYEMQTGQKFPDRPSDDDEASDGGDGDSGQPGVSPDDPQRHQAITGMEIVDPNAEGGPDNVGVADDPEDYAEWSFQELKDEIDERNRLRGDSQEEPISKGGSAEDLRERLMADDEAQQEDEEEPEDDGSNSDDE